MAYSFHPSNLTLHLASTPKSGMFTAVATAGKTCISDAPELEPAP